jgi:hypothetical protein
VDGSVQSSWFGSNQKYASSTTSYAAGKIINTKTGSSGSVVFSYSLPKSVNYIFASYPTSVSNNAPSFATATSVTACKGDSHSHSYDSGTVTTAATSTSAGVMTYTCTKCGVTENQTIPMTVSISACDHSVEQEEIVDKGYTVTFAGDNGVDSVTVYRTQDYNGTYESISASGSTVSRSSATGEPDSTGSGQVNFTIVLKDGYELVDVSVTEGTYKNIKDPSDTGVANTYRITKIGSELTISVTTKQSETDSGNILGDVNGDGDVNINDVTDIQKHIAHIIDLEGTALQAADTNCDDTINIIDVTTLQKYIANYDLPYPIGEAVTQ